MVELVMLTITLLPLVRYPINTISGAWHLELLFLYCALCILYAHLLWTRRIKISGLGTATFLTLLLGTVFILGEATAKSIYVTLSLGLCIWVAPLLYYFIREHRRVIVPLLLCSLTLHAIWGVAQFALQADLNLSPLGETTVIIGQPGIATLADTSGHKLIRAYGPYAHPNILAGSLLIGLIAGAYYVSERKQPLTLSQMVIGYFILLAILFSFSRAAWLAAAALALVSCWTPTKNVRVLVVFITLLTCAPLLLLRSPTITEAAFAERLSGTSEAIAILQKLPVWRGVGPGNYEHILKRHLLENDIPHEPWQISPVHNVPLLALVEWGAVPVILAGAWVIYHFHSRFRHTWPYLLPLIPLLAFDHYLLTQPAPLVYCVLLLMTLAEPPSAEVGLLVPLPMLVSPTDPEPTTTPTQQTPQ